MILRRLAAALRRQDWFTVGLEIMIVVLGVFIGIQVANWNETRVERDLERTYLTNLHQDFVVSLQKLEENERRMVEIIEAMRTLLDRPDGARPASAEALNGLFAKVQGMPTFNWISRTYDNLVGAGQLRLIRDPTIGDALADFDAQTRLIELVQATHEQQLVETFQPWIIEHMDYIAVHLDRLDGEFPLPPAREADRILELIDTREFRNLLVQKWTIITDLLNQNRDLETSARQLIALLDPSADE
jgi:hypothetical protein